jgi:hypothetical protein
VGQRASQQGHRLSDISPGGGGADAEPGGQLGKHFAFAQVGQDEEGLLPGVELAPGRADLPTVAADDPAV